MIEIVLLEELANLLSTINGQNIPYLLLKGQAIRHLEYPDFSQRPCADTDLWIEPSSLPHLCGILHSLNYTQIPSPSFGHNRHQISFTKTLHRQIESIVDVHFKLSNRSRHENVFQFSECLESARLVSVFSAPALSPLHALAHAALHLQGHHRDEIQAHWVYDLHLIIGKRPEQFQLDFYQLCVQKNILYDVAWALNLSQKMFQTLLCKNWQAYISTQKFNYDAPSWWKEIYIDVLEGQGLKTKLVKIMEHLFPQKDFMKVKYTHSRLPLWALYLRRFFGAIYKIIRKR